MYSPGFAQDTAVPQEIAVRAFTSIPIIDALLRHTDPLRLSPEQGWRLRLLRVDLQAKQTQLAAEKQVLELQLARRQESDPVGFKPSEEELRNIEQLGVRVRLADYSGRQQVGDILTTEQRVQFFQQWFPPTPLTGSVDSSSAVLDQHIEAALGRRLKDTKVVEYETSEAIANHLIEWGKIFTLLVGLPLAILAGVLAVLGFRSYDDVRTRARSALDEINKQMQEATRIQTDLTVLQDRLTAISKLERSVDEIAAQVDRIQQFVDFRKSEELTPEVQKSLEQTLFKYIRYLARIGFQLPETRPSVSIDAKVKDNAFYVPPNKIVIAEALAGDPDVVLREYTHHVLHDAKGAQSTPIPFTAIQSGLADYFPCSSQNNPRFAEKAAPVFNRIYGKNLFPNGYVRVMDNQRRFDEIHPGMPKQQGGEVWGGVFWEIRGRLGQEQTDRLLLEAWRQAESRDDSPGSFADFARTVVSLAGRHNTEAEADVQAIIERRGLALAVAEDASGRA